MSPSVSVASRRITLSQRPLRDLCSLVFDATRLKETTKKITSEISMLEYPFGCWNQVNPTIFEICLLYENIPQTYMQQDQIDNCLINMISTIYPTAKTKSRLLPEFLGV